MGLLMTSFSAWSWMASFVVLVVKLLRLQPIAVAVWQHHFMTSHFDDVMTNYRLRSLREIKKAADLFEETIFKEKVTVAIFHRLKTWLFVFLCEDSCCFSILRLNSCSRWSEYCNYVFCFVNCRLLSGMPKMVDSRSFYSIYTMLKLVCYCM